MQNFASGEAKFCHPLENINAQPRCGFALRKPTVLRVFPPDEFRYGTV
jgi:hypothetical protein